MTIPYNLKQSKVVLTYVSSYIHSNSRVATKYLNNTLYLSIIYFYENVITVLCHLYSSTHNLIEISHDLHYTVYSLYLFSKLSWLFH